MDHLANVSKSEQMGNNFLSESELAYKERVRERWTPKKRYNIKQAILYRRIEKYRPLLKKLKKGVGVDLGCGTGIWTKELFDPSSKMVIGIDFSLGALNVAKEYCPHGTYILGDLDHLPFRSKCIDAFFSFTSIYYLFPDSQNKLFAELYRILKNGGNILLIEPNAQCVIKDKGTYPLHRGRVEQRLREAGFKRVAIELRGFVPAFIKRRNKKDPIFRSFHFLESIVESFQVPFLLGGLIIYAEK